MKKKKNFHSIFELTLGSDTFDRSAAPSEEGSTAGSASKACKAMLSQREAADCPTDIGRRQFSRYLKDQQPRFRQVLAWVP